MRNLAENPQSLRDAGITEDQIRRMQDGGVPTGWNVHHKRSLDSGGTNSPDNLVLIQNEPYHKVITNHQNSNTRGLSPGESVNMDWPISRGNIYPSTAGGSLRR